jgi:predicted nuclease of restriction endonuclease-like RecB superfamily
MTAARQRLFRLAAAGLPQQAAIERAAHEHGLAGPVLLARLFADLPGEWTVHWPSPLDPSRVLLLANTTLVQGLLRHAERATVSLRGAARAVLRTAWLHGTALTVAAADGGHARLVWRAAAAGRRSLAAIVPLLPWAQRYEVRAWCTVGQTTGTLVLGTGDPILPGPEPRQFDSGLERTFARDFAATTSAWRLLREPLPIALAEGHAFPDFELHRPRDGSRWLLEITGLRNPAALPNKLALLDHPRCLVCLPAAAVPAHLRGHARIVSFGRRVRASDVLAALGRLAGPV